MFKKVLSILTVFAVIVVFSSCTADTNEDTSRIDETAESVTSETTEKQKETSEIINSQADSTEELEFEIIKYVEDEIAALNDELTSLTERITTYDKYVKNIDDVEAFYEKVSNTSEFIAVRLCEYSIVYSEMILDSDMTTDEMYDASDDLYDCIYDDAADILYDGIYDGVLKDLYDAFYDGVISDGMDSANYSEWYDISSDAYELWYDISSDCYEHWYDMHSDVYGFWSDVRSELFGNDIEGARDEIADFKEDVEKMKQD